jgi:uncharacterized protein YbjT (DUF2867 family)
LPDKSTEGIDLSQNPVATGGESKDGRAALVLGATGLVGSHCLDILLDDDRYRLVRTLGRRNVDQSHPRLEQHIVDLEKLDSRPELFEVNEVFCCLGTTIRKAGSQEAFRKVDVEAPASAALLASEAGADQFLVVSALGADAHSRIFYNRCKGEMEAMVGRAALQAVWILRPALILGDRELTRLGETIAETLLRPIAPLMIGRLRRFRPVHARTIAAAMVAVARPQATGGILESEEIPVAARAL